MSNELALIYDEFAATYEQNRGLFDMTEVFDEFFQRLPAQGGSLLDLGCGAGEPFATAFLRRDWSVTGVDFSNRMLELARQFAPGMQTRLGDMRQMTFDAESFDAVISIYALFHLPSEDHADMLARIHRWLKPAGHALLTYADQAYTGQERFDGLKEFMGRQLYYGHKAPSELRRDLSRIGFEILEWRHREIGGESFPWITLRKSA